MAGMPLEACHEAVRARTSVREVETRATLSGAEERDECAARLAEVAHGPHTEVISDTRFAVALEGFDGMARVRERRQGDVVRYEWAVKEFQPRDGLRVAKAHIEHEGEADSYEDALDALYAFLYELRRGHAALTVARTSTRTRSSYLHNDGTTIHMDTYTSRDGTDLDPPHESVEFERVLPVGASPEEVQEAEAQLIATAESIGITEDRLSSASGMSSRQTRADTPHATLPV